jgi:hypothetical protein
VGSGRRRVPRSAQALGRFGGGDETTADPDGRPAKLPLYLATVRAARARSTKAGHQSLLVERNRSA